MADIHGGPSVPAVLREAVEDETGDVYVVGIRESREPGSWSLLLMEPFDPEDPQEIELGMDTYCLVVDPGQATYYGGVRECEIKAGVLRLLLTCEAAQTLGLPTEALFRLELPTAEAAVLSVGLSRVLSSGRANERPILLDLSYHID